MAQQCEKCYARDALWLGVFIWSQSTEDHGLSLRIPMCGECVDEHQPYRIEELESRVKEWKKARTREKRATKKLLKAAVLFDSTPYTRHANPT